MSPVASTMIRTKIVIPTALCFSFEQGPTGGFLPSIKQEKNLQRRSTPTPSQYLFTRVRVSHTPILGDVQDTWEYPAISDIQADSFQKCFSTGHTHTVRHFVVFLATIYMLQHFACSCIGKQMQDPSRICIQTTTPFITC